METAKASPLPALSRHRCLIYEGSPAPHLPALASVIGQKLKANHRCLYLNSRPMVAGVRSYLFACGINVPNEISKGSLVLSSEEGHLKDGRFDIDHMLAILDAAVNEALSEGYHGLWATGDMSWEFGPEKDFSKLVEYERRLEELFHRQPTLSGICQYHADTLPAETVQHGLITHQAVFVNQTLSRLNPDYLPVGLVASTAGQA